MTHTTFNPNSAAQPGSGIFGLPFKESDSAIVLIPVPWEATTSYGGGTSKGPKAILNASRQVDLYDIDVERPYAAGISMLREAAQIAKWNGEARTPAKKIIAAGGLDGSKALATAAAKVNALGAKLNALVFTETKRLYAAGKIVGVIGGDHSTPFGAIHAATEKFGTIGILHFDAHSDTRDAYEGFTWSHASIMRNVLERVPGVTKLVQVGIRDFCDEEAKYCESQGARVRTFFDADLARRKFSGETWNHITTDIVSTLPDRVWVSFDIDGLDPRLCPNTGTPVPGGLDFQEAVNVVLAVARSGKRIVGFDLNEVAPDPKGANEWDANVGARLLYKLCALTLASQGRAKLTPRS